MSEIWTHVRTQHLRALAHSLADLVRNVLSRYSRLGGSQFAAAISYRALDRRGAGRHTGLALAHQLGVGYSARGWRRAPPISSATSAGRSCSPIFGVLLTAGVRGRPPAVRARGQQRLQPDPGRADEVVRERGRHRRPAPDVSAGQHHRRGEDRLPAGRPVGLPAGIVAVLLGAALVWLKFPKRDAGTPGCSPPTRRRTPPGRLRRRRWCRRPRGDLIPASARGWW